MTLEENNCNITKLDMVKSDADVTVTGERDIDAVIWMKQEHCSVPEDCDRITEEYKIDVKTEADSVDDIRFPSTYTEEVINVKREMTEANAFVGVKAETDCEEVTTVKTEVKKEIAAEEIEVDAVDCSAVTVGELCHHEEEFAVTDRLQAATSHVPCWKQKECISSVCTACGITFTSDPTCSSQTCGLCSEAMCAINIRPQVPYEEEGTELCTDCGKLFSVPSRLNKHTCTCRGKNHYECNECGALLATKQNLDRHKLYHSGETPFQCSTCGKQFTESRNLRQHLNRQHKNEKPCQCKVCHKVFATEYILKTHSKVHSMNKTFSCQECGKHFSRPSSVAIHARLHSGEKPYVCRECGRRFSVHHTLKIHYRIHTGEKPYDCNYCKRKFRVLQGLSLHLRTHTGEKPYRCNECGKVFAKYSVLKKHELTHKVKKSFECDKCGKIFLQSGYLKPVSNEVNNGGDSAYVQQVPQGIHTRQENKTHQLPTAVRNRKEERSDIAFHSKRLKFGKSVAARKKTDEYGAFGKFVAQELRSLRSEVNRRLLKRVIQRAVLKFSELDDKKQATDE